MKTIFYQNKISADALINPTDLTKPVKEFPKICISAFSKGIIDKFASLDHVEVITQLYSANGCIPIYKITYEGREIAFYQSLVGAPACVCGFEEAAALGAEKFVFFGSYGILDDHQVNNRLIVPTAAVRDEGTSYHYIAPSEELTPTKEATAVLQQCLEKCGYPYTMGKIWTTDAIYRETLDVIQERKKDGCIAVDMEYSALLAVSQYRKLPLIQFFYGADSLDSAVWQPRDLTDYGLSGAEKYFALAMECGISM